MSVDDITYELQELRRGGLIVGTLEVECAFSSETETAIEALASHFTGDHGMCDHPKPPKKPEEIAGILRMWGWEWDKSCQIFRLIKPERR